jgi:2-keto-4-pentenoate hydratase
MPAPIERIAGLFVEARRAGRPFAVPADVPLDSSEDAYRVQDAVFARLWPGKWPGAWKAGSARDGDEPTGAPIASANVHLSPARLAASGMSMIGIEAEVAYRIGHDVAMGERRLSEHDLAAVVVEALVAIEICDTRLADWEHAPPLWRLADFQNNDTLVVGDGTRAWREIDFRAQPVELRIGKRTVTARGAHPWGNPLRLLPWAAAHCARRGKPLRAGDLVTTGSWTGLEHARPGDEVVARFPGIGEASLRIE